MALQTCALNLDRELKELQPHGTLGFPCAGYAERYGEGREAAFPWHWHEEIELVYAKDGGMEIQVPSDTLRLEKGGMIAVNSNILHAGFAPRSCLLHSLVFSPLLVGGTQSSVFAEKYVLPLTSCQAFSAACFFGEAHKEIVRDFCRAFRAMQREPEGFEFTVRESLSRIVLALSKMFADKIDVPTGGQNNDNLRMRAMLEFIHQNYARPLALSEIAGAAHVGERECLRCFRKTIRVSPVQYLMKYRVMLAAQALQKNPAHSISEISFACGFDSPSRFSALFKRFYNCTPKEYRKSMEST